MTRTALRKTALYLALVLALGAGVAHAEQAREGNIAISFSSAISPVRLPRSAPAPISVRMGAKIKTTDRSTPPKLERILLQINSHGKIQSQGLATCSLKKLESISSNAAKRVCGDALIGHGNVTSRVSLPGQGPFATNGSLLAFNGRIKGHEAVLAQVASGAPLPLTYVIPFEIKKTKGTFGSSSIGTLPPIASEYGYISAFDLSLGRTYADHGKKLAYASASCPAPKGFSAAPFPLAKASYEFADGRTLSATMERQCKVKGR